MHIKKSNGKEIVEDNRNNMKPVFKGAFQKKKEKHILEVIDERTNIYLKGRADLGPKLAVQVCGFYCRI